MTEKETFSPSFLMSPSAFPCSSLTPDPLDRYLFTYIIRISVQLCSEVLSRGATCFPSSTSPSRARTEALYPTHKKTWTTPNIVSFSDERCLPPPSSNAVIQRRNGRKKKRRKKHARTTMPGKKEWACEADDYM